MDTVITNTVEQQRLDDISRLLPKNRHSVLEIGARHGLMTRILTRHYPEVVALDLEMPVFQIKNVVNVKGDVTNLEFENNSFDVVICTEVLEHVNPDQVGQACREISRVARYEALIGVPYRQDIRLHRTTCVTCGRKNPSYGHVNSFDQEALEQYFEMMRAVEVSKVGPASPRTNAVSAWLMDYAGNPWGTYSQEEPCVYCGGVLKAPGARNFSQKIASKISSMLTKTQNKINRQEPYWIHMLFRTKAD